jgi:hypothetical protein
MKLIYLGLNLRFNIGVVFMTNYFLVRGDVLINNETLLMTDFVNLKIKLTQSFECAHIDRVYVHIFIRVTVYTCINIYVDFVFTAPNSLPVLLPQQADKKRRRTKGLHGRLPSPCIYFSAYSGLCCRKGLRCR